MYLGQSNIRTMIINKLVATVVVLSISITIGFSQLKVTATTTMIADIAQNIAGDKLEVSSIVPTGSDPHTFEPIPADVEKIRQVQLVLMNGLSLEGWMTEFVENSGTKAKVVITTEGIKTIKSATYDTPDPHAWTDAANGIIYAENIKNAFVELDAANAATYEANFESYKAKLEALDAAVKTAIQSIPEKHRILITSHDAFQYYGQKYGLKMDAILGTSTDAEAQISDFVRVQKAIQETGVPAIFIESTINPQQLQQLAKDNGISIGGKLFADSLDKPEKKAGTYIGMIQANTETIVKGLTAPKQETVEEEGETNWLFTGVIAALLLGGIFFMIRRLN